MTRKLSLSATTTRLFSRQEVDLPYPNATPMLRVKDRFRELHDVVVVKEPDQSDDDRWHRHPPPHAPLVVEQQREHPADVVRQQRSQEGAKARQAVLRQLVEELDVLALQSHAERRFAVNGHESEHRRCVGSECDRQ